MAGEGDKFIKKKKKILAGIRKKLKKNHTFHYLSRYSGKGLTDNIKRSQVVNENDNVEETIIKREEIENRIKSHNTARFKKAHNSIAYKDKTHDELRHNSIRDKMLNGTLQREDYDDGKVY